MSGLERLVGLKVRITVRLFEINFILYYFLWPIFFSFSNECKIMFITTSKEWVFVMFLDKLVHLWFSLATKHGDFTKQRAIDNIQFLHQLLIIGFQSFFYYINAIIKVYSFFLYFTVNVLNNKETRFEKYIILNLEFVWV